MTISARKLLLVVPALIAFLSAYWFRKKRKLKAITDANSNVKIIPVKMENAEDQRVADPPSSPNHELVEPCNDISSTCGTHAEAQNFESYLFTNGHATMLESCHSDSDCDDDDGCAEQQKLDDSETSLQNDTCPENDGNASLVREIDLTTIDDSRGASKTTESLNLAESLEQEDFLPKDISLKPETIPNGSCASFVDQNSTQCEGMGITSENLMGVTEVLASVGADYVTDSVSEPISNTSDKADGCEASSLGVIANGIDRVDGGQTSDSFQKSSPTSIGSPVSHNNDAGSDCEALSSVGTSSISLSELFSTSPVDSMKEQTNFQIDEEASVDSGKGSTINLEPSSSCSMSSDVSVGLLSQEPPKSNFRYSRRSNADVLCRQDHESIEQAESVPDSYRYYDESSSHMKKCMDYFTDPSGGMGSNLNYVQVIDSKTFETSLSEHYVYEFELPQELCGRLIGRLGQNVKFIKERSNATVYIKRHPYQMHLKMAVVEGSRCDVHNALDLLRKKFPPSQFPNITFAQTNASRRCHLLYYLLPPPSYIFNSGLLNFNDMCSGNSFSQLHLPESTSVDVILSSMVNAGHFFLQQPTHPSYPSLSTLDQCMMSCYSQTDTPLLPQLAEGVVCAATVMGGWYRAQVMCVFESGEDCEVKFVDYGGYSQVNSSSMRQIRSDFMTLPFQASECYLAKVQPINVEAGWSQEASSTFEELAQGQILQAVIVDYHEDGNPYVYLYRVQGISSTFINRELVNRGLAKWIEQ